MLALLLRGVAWVDAHLTRLAIKLVRWTGKSKEAIHPKHLVDTPHHYWYVERVRAGDRVLDVGCGIGAAVLRVASRAAFVVGFDYDVCNLRKAKRVCCEQGISNALCFAADAEMPLPFADACFDTALVLDVIEHLNRRVALLQEIGRVLRPGGLVLLSAPNRNNSWKRVLRSAGLPYYADADHKTEYTLVELEEELTLSGLEIVGTPQPTVLETPLAGVIDTIGGISLRLYARLQRWKVKAARRRPGEATGWRVVCRKPPS